MLMNANNTNNNAPSQLEKFIGRFSIEDLTAMPEYQGILYHYTSTKNINSILSAKNNKIILWASRYNCLNDITEGNLIKEIYSKACESLKNKNQISDSLYKEIKCVQPNKTILFCDKKKAKYIRDEVNTYIASFSQNSDLLAMWNYYSKGSLCDGINLGFDTKSIKTSLENYDSSLIDIQICPVIYDEGEQIKLIEQFILLLQSEYKDSSDNMFIRYVIAHKLIEWSMIFKYKYFEHENEARIVVRVCKKATGVLQPKFRTHLGYLIPYIELEFEKEALSHVTFGPMFENENRKMSQGEIMTEFLKSNHYNAKIDFSNVPIRY